MLRLILVLAAVVAMAYSQDARDPTTIDPHGCGRPNKGRDSNYHPAKIVGGNEALPNYWNWQFSMVYFGSHRCGGSVINSQWLLTAAHCTVGLSAANVNVRLGSHYRTSGGSLHSISRIVNHPAYGSGTTYANDIALMKLTTPISYTENIAPVCLTDSKTSTADIAGNTAWVTGWGTLSSGGVSPNVLHEVAVDVDTDTRCAGAYGTSFAPSSMICASGPGKDSCQGDSGGPMVMERSNGEFELIGVVSWGRGCALPAYPGVYSKVAALREWVEGVVASN